jgi:hypothetical protein
MADAISSNPPQADKLRNKSKIRILNVQNKTFLPLSTRLDNFGAEQAALPSTFVKTSDSASVFAFATTDRCATPDKSANKSAGKHRFLPFFHENA